MPLTAVECGPGGPSPPLPDLHVPRMGEHDREEARLVTELQPCHRPGGLQSHRAQAAPPHGPRGAASPCSLLLPLSGEVLAEVLSSLLFRVFLKTETVDQAVFKWTLPLAPPARVACGSRTESSCCFVLILLSYRCIKGVFLCH